MPEMRIILALLALTLIAAAPDPAISAHMTCAGPVVTRYPACNNCLGSYRVDVDGGASGGYVGLLEVTGRTSGSTTFGPSNWPGVDEGTHSYALVFVSLSGEFGSETYTSGAAVNCTGWRLYAPVVER